MDQGSLLKLAEDLPPARKRGQVSCSEVSVLETEKETIVRIRKPSQEGVSDYQGLPLIQKYDQFLCQEQVRRITPRLYGIQKLQLSKGQLVNLVVASGLLGTSLTLMLVLLFALPTTGVSWLLCLISLIGSGAIVLGNSVNLLDG